MLKQLFIYFFVLMMLCTCREDFEQNIATSLPTEPSLLADYEEAESMVISSVTGFVSDKDEMPLQNALVVLNGYVSLTDEFGHFFFTDIPMNAKGAFINITLSDYHLGSKLFYPASGATEHLEVVMTKIKSNSDVSGLSNGSVNIDASYLIEYNEGAFLNANGNIYEGMVSISSSVISPDETLFAKQVLGNLQGVNLENKLIGLIPHSMLHLSFKDSNGDQLIISEAGEVELIIPSGDFPEDASAWYYVPKYGLYTVNSELEKSDTQWRLQLKHNESILVASNYNSEIDAIFLKAADGTEVLENVEVELFDNTETPIYTTRTNSMGQASIPYPTNLVAKMLITDACGNIVFNELTTGANTSLILDQIEVKSLEGDVYDCDVKPSGNNVVRIRQGEQTHYHYLSNSHFSIKLQTCNQGIATATALENVEVDLGILASIDLNDTNNLGDLFTCEDPTVNQLKITDTETGDIYTYPISSTVTSDANSTSFRNSEINNVEEFIISFQGSEVGDYSTIGDHFIERIYDNANGLRIAGDAEAFEVDRFGDIDRITLGTFSGTFENTATSETINIKGDFNFYFQE